MPHQKITQALVDGLPYPDSGTLWVHDTELAGVNLSIGQRTKTYYAAGEHGNHFIRVKIGRADVTKANVARGCARPKSSRCTGTRLTSTRARSGSAWVARRSPVMRQLHAAGEKLFVDHADARIEGACPETGEVRQAQPFVTAPAPRQTAPAGLQLPTRVLRDLCGAGVFNEVGQAGEAASYDCCPWWRVGSAVKMACGTCDRPDAELEVAR
ncbi:hypothetical protein BYZ73_04555 [Rhodovulum viride]|uniref:Integrase-like protein n=1 Tax=Rhodovulum viride TaxID=1231134 RepID=A0ABX9DJA4_9RHOB|nr:hypothetical protein [Rhodovulum viride]RAP42466.1 hypothetical protein BYZ73_04555 [Rhodovulum viride]